MPQLVLNWGDVSGRTACQSWVETQGVMAATHILKTLPDGGCLCVYGPKGVGKTHLLAMADELGHTTQDDVENLSLDQQEELFHTFNRVKAEGGHMVVASRVPVAQIQLLPDVKSRLLTGTQVEMTLPIDDELNILLLRWAEDRQLLLPDAVRLYVLARAERNPHTLAALVQRLDALSLEQKRAVTVPLARELGI
jgi:DnaA family protein